MHDEKKHKFHSFVAEGIHVAACLAEVVLCLIYQATNPSFADDVLLFFMLLLMFPCILGLIVIPVCIVHNVKQAVSSYKDKNSRWMLWSMRALLSPLLCLAFLCLAGWLFVKITGA